MTKNLPDSLNERVIELVQNLKLIIFDFDGVFTDNSVLVDQNGVESVRCSRSDGLGLRRLDEVGIKYCIVSTETNPVVTTRAKKLKIPVTQGHDDKLSIVRNLALENNINMNNIAFMGNDINDKECLKEVGLPIVVADAFPEVIETAKYRTKKLGGYGAVREVCDLVYKYHTTNRGSE
jgi:YrbI family 3-deoxy-D-manno-octulosonate 8-phosphate phosphatase